MNFNLDLAIFITFLSVNLGLGIWSSRGIKNINEYALGGRNFSTATLVATIIATWVCGNYIFLGIVEAYNSGLNFIWIAALGDFLSLFLIGSFFAPRMGEFLGKLSIAEAMGDIYGKKVLVVTAISGLIGVCGIIAMQFKMAGLVFEYALDIPSIYGIISAAVIVTLYSTFGGIKSVTFTDVIQLITFGIVIPVMAYSVFVSLENRDVILKTLTTNPLFDYKKTFNFSIPESQYYLFLFLFFATPAFNAAIFQRISMARNISQASYSFIISAFTCLFLILIVSWIGILLLSTYPNIKSDDIIRHLISNYSFSPGYKGIILAGIMAMVMSTVDSHINSSAVILTHDLLKTIKVKFIISELFTARIVSAFIGVLSLLLSLRENSLLDLIILTYSLYMPVVTVPFIMTIIGFRSSEKSVLLGMFAGVATILIWDYILQIKEINSVPFGMLANLITLFSSHYILKQQGGWVGINDDTQLKNMRNERKRTIKRLLQEVTNFSLIKIIKKNSPKGDGFISILGIFVMTSAFASAFTLAKKYQIQYASIINVIYFISLASSTILITYPLWLESWKQNLVIGIVWNSIMFAVLICCSLLSVLISNFAEIQMMMFMVNIIILSTVITWRWALFSIILGIVSTTMYYEKFISSGLVESSLTLEFKIAYLLLLIVSIIIIFLKPKQEYQELTEEKVDHLSHRIDEKDEEIEEALALKAEFIRNVNHEYHAPMTGVISMAEALKEGYDNLSDDLRKEAIDVIIKSSYRLKTFDDNIAILSRLSKPNFKLKKENLNFSDLIYDRQKACRKLYQEDNKNREFIFEIEEGIMANLDKEYITQLLDNLIINAIKYCTKGKITISANKNNDRINLAIEDEGIGVPKDEILEIFEPFVVSSKTRSRAGGRGVGLSTCSRIVEVHEGTITADSNGNKGTIFRVIFPACR